ncbi:MAG: protein kinase domain-containing protein [Candidatus Acidiferrales bacterium]
MSEPTEPKRSPVVPDLTGTTVGRFHVRAKIGEGGMGQVYRAEDTRLKRSVALKRMSPYLRNDEHYRRRFLKEAERASALSYDNIAGVYDVFEEAGEIFIVMEYVEGETLRHRLQRPFTVKEFLPIALQCVAALEAAHAKGIAHRDLKPENIMLTAGGRAKILDFGVAKLLPQARDQAATESLGSVGGEGFSGTVAYAAPEALMEQELDERADIFSLGVVFYEMLAGQHPFRVAGFTATTDRILHHAPEPLARVNPAVPAELERIIHRMLAKEPAGRQATAAELLSDLRRLKRPQPDAAPAPLRETKPPARLPLLGFTIRQGFVIAVVLALVITAGILYRILQGPATPPERIRIAVLPFANRTDQPQLDAVRWAMTEVFISELTGSPNIQVLPYERLRELTDGLEKQGKDPSSSEAARIVGSYSNAQYVVVPSLTLVGSTARLQADFRNAQTGETIDNRNIQRSQAGPTADTFYGMLGELAGETQKYFKNVGAGKDYTPRPEGSRPRLDVAIHYADGKAAFTRGEYSQALKSLEQAIELDRQYAMAYAWTGKIYGLLGHSQKAREFSEQADRLVTPETPAIDTYFIQANLAERKYEFSVAEEKYQQLIRWYPDDAVWHISLGDVYEKEGQYGKAIASYQEALSREGNSVVAHQGLAVLYGLTQDREQALQHAQKALDNCQALDYQEGRAGTLLILAEILRLKGELAQAREHTESALRLYRDQKNEIGILSATKTLGDITFSQGDFAAARRYWEQVISSSAELQNNRVVARTLMNIGVTYEREGELARAVEYYNRSLEHKDFPSLLDRSRALYNLGGILVQYGPNPERGVQLVQEALENFEAMENTRWIANGRMVQGMYLTNSARYPEALEKLREAHGLFRSLEAKDRVVLTEYNTGRCYLSHNEYRSAADSLRAAWALAKEIGNSFAVADAQIQLARVEIRLGEEAKARALLAEVRPVLETAGELKPDAFNTLGELDWQAGERERARRYFQQASAVWKDPHVSESSVEARSNLGLLEAEQGNRARGLALSQQAVEGARRLQHAHTLARTVINLARVHLLRGEHPKALELLEEIAGADKANLGLEYRAQAFYWRGKALDGLGRAPEAQESYGRAQAALEKLQQSLTAEEQKKFAARRDIQPLLR